MKNCIFTGIFKNKEYIDIFYLFLESIHISGNLNNNTDILVYTSTEFMNIIKENHLYSEKIKFEINDTCNTVDKACKARLDLFDLKSISNYNKILYLDIDIIIKNDINILFDICKDEILYVLEEGCLQHESTIPDMPGHLIDAHGRQFFTNQEVNNMKDTTAFTSAIMLFKNCDQIKKLFNNIKKHIASAPATWDFSTWDQPYIVYNAFKYKLFNNKVLKPFCSNGGADEEIVRGNKIIHHFCGNPKIVRMNDFLNTIKIQKGIKPRVIPLVYSYYKPVAAAAAAAAAAGRAKVRQRRVDHVGTIMKNVIKNL
jgi:hypothetical protein